jgi:hypothetical protein
MNKKLWVGVYFVSALIFFAALLTEIVLAILMIDEIVQPAGLAVAMVTVGVIGYLQFMLVHMISLLVLVYTIWDALQDGVTDVSPGKAVGFLFIPVYNLYWLFRVWAGYPTDYNQYLERHRLAAPPLSGTLFTIFPIAILLSGLLVLPILILPFVTIFVIARACDAVNNLKIARAAAEQGRSAAPSEFIGTAENPRSKMPVFAMGGALLIGAFIAIGFGIFAWFNLSPKPSAEVVPAQVGTYTLQPGGRPNGSILGGKSYFFDYIYASEEGGSKKMLNYNVSLFGSDAEPKRWINSMCSSYQPATLKDASGNEAGKYCTSAGALFLSKGNNTLRIHTPANYEMDKLKAKGATSADMIAFAKELPWLKGIDFGASPVSTAPTSTTPGTSTTTPGSSTAVSKDAKADLTMTGDEFYKATKGKPAAELAQFNGKVIEITARMYSTTANSVMLMSGNATFWANFGASEAAAFESGKESDRLVMKCVAEAGSSVDLKRCTLIENKKIIAATDKPDFTFTAEEFWRTVGSYEVPSATRSKKWEELRGKIVKITGNVKAVGGNKANLAGGTSWFSCKPDDENKSMFDALTDGQSVTLMAVHGVASLEHCIVASK